jgi:hypothetical protein
MNFDLPAVAPDVDGLLTIFQQRGDAPERAAISLVVAVDIAAVVDLADGKFLPLRGDRLEQRQADGEGVGLEVGAGLEFFHGDVFLPFPSLFSAELQMTCR